MIAVLNAVILFGITVGFCVAATACFFWVAKSLRPAGVILGSAAFILIMAYLQFDPNGATGLRDDVVSWIEGVFFAIETSVANLGFTGLTGLASGVSNLLYGITDWIQLLLRGRGDLLAPLYMNMLIVIAYLVARWLILIVPWIVRLAARANKSKKENDEGENEKELRWWLHNKTMLHLSRGWFLAIALFVVVVGTAFSVLAVVDPFASPGLTRIADGLASVLNEAGFLYWSALFILLAEIYAAIENPDLIRAFFRAPKEEPNDPDKKSLSSLFDTYVKFGKSVGGLATFVEPPQTRAAKKGRKNGDAAELEEFGSALTAEARVQIYQTLEAFGNGTVRTLIEGNLTNSYYEILAEFLRRTQDKGGVVLVLCPDASETRDSGQGASFRGGDDVADQVIRNLRNKMGSGYFDLTHTVRNLGDGSAGGGFFYNLIVGSEYQLNAILRDDRASLEPMLRKLRLIVFVDFHRLDPAMVRLQISQIRDIRGDIDQVSIVCQSEPRSSQNENLDYLFGVRGEELFFQKLLVSRPLTADRYMLAWRERPAVVSGLKNKYLPQTPAPAHETLPLLAIPAWEEAGRVAIYDPSRRLDRQKWANDWVNNLANSNISVSMTSSGKLAQDTPVSLVGQAEQSQIVFMEDHLNIAEALCRRADVIDDADRMVHIVSKPYAARDYLFDRIKASNKTGQAGLFFAAGVNPIPPEPKTCLAELAHAVATQAKSDDGIPHGKLRSMLGEDTDGTLDPKFESVLRKLQVSASCRGIERLISLSFGETVKAERMQMRHSRDLAYQLSNGHGAVPSDPFVTKIVDTAGQQTEVGQSQVGDEGLFYAVDSNILLSRHFYAVQNIEHSGHNVPREFRLGVTRQAQKIAGQINSRPNYVFWRTYHPWQRQSDNSRMPDFALEQSRLQGGMRQNLLHACFRRTSSGYTVHAHNYAPLSELAGTTDVVFPAIEVHRSFQPVLTMTLNVGEGPEWNEHIPEIENIAFTLAACLQDLLESFFVEHARRIAVFSPQSHATFQPNKQQPRDGYRGPKNAAELAAFWYPSCATISQDDGPTSLWSAMCNTQEDGNAAVPAIGTANRQIEIVVLEDAPLDLGVVRALHRRWGDVEETWKDYLHYLASTGDSKDAYHKFGTGSVAQQFQYKLAHDWLIQEVRHAP